MQQPKKRININIPSALHDMIRVYAAEKNTTITEIITQYFQYLKNLSKPQRKMLNENSAKVFEPNADSSRELHESIDHRE